MDNVIDKISKCLYKAKSVALFPHISADPDALGACAAFKKALENMGKTAVIYTDAKPREHFDFIGADCVIYDKDVIYDHDLALVLDCGDILRLGNRVKLFNETGVGINIDHHKTNTHFADINFVEPEASSTCEILYRLFKPLNIKIDDEIARFLYIGISSDTGSFKYSNVTPESMRAAADLLEYDFDHSEISRLMYDSENINIIRFRAELMQSIELYASGRVSAVQINDDMYEKYGVPSEEAPNVVDIPRCVEGVEIALAFRRKDDGISVNFRSNGNADVAEIALKFGGGGHAKAAGCTVYNKELAAVKDAVIKECITAVNDL